MRLIFLLSLLLASLVFAQTLYGPSVEVSRSSLIYIVYSDGAIQPVYNATFYVAVPEHEVGGGLVLSAFDDYAGRLEVGGYNLSGVFIGDFGNSSTYFAVAASWADNYTYGVGGFRLSASLEAGNFTSRQRIYLRLTGTLSNFTAYFTLSLYLPVSALAGSPPKLPTVDEINRNLTKAGVDYLRVTSIGGRENSTTVEIDVEGVLDLLKAAQSAATAGADNKSVAAFKELVGGKYELVGGGNVSFYMNLTGSRLSLGGLGSWRYEGDLHRYDVLWVTASEAISIIVQNAELGIASALGAAPSPVGVITQLGPSSQLGSAPLVPKAPSHLRLLLSISATPQGNSTAFAVNISLVGHRVAVINSTGNPARDAEAALAYAPLEYSQIAQLLGGLALVAPGVQGLLPNTVALKPGDPNVEISPAVVKPMYLPQVSVVIINATSTSSAATQTAASTTTTRVTTSTSSTTQTATSAQTATRTGGASSVQTSSAGASKTSNGVAIAAVAAVVVAAAVVAFLLVRRR